MNIAFPWLEDVTRISQRVGPGLSAEIAAVPLPPLYHVRQNFPRPVIVDVEEAVAAQFGGREVRGRTRRGAGVGIAVGSRGIARIGEIGRAVVREVKRLGAGPFITPAMGSHGGATPEGQ